MDIESHFNDVYVLIQSSKTKIYKKVNTELIDLYWQIGEYISSRLEKGEWGKSIVNSLANYIHEKDPTIKGFSAQNLWRMRQFFQTYPKYSNLSALTRELSWTNNLLIISKSKSEEERAFYLNLSIKESFSSRELERQIDSGIYERSLVTGSNLSSVLREIHPESNKYFKDQYVLDFLSLTKPYLEKDLRKGIVAHLKEFILEFGKDFTFIGEEYRVQVGNKDFYVDLLFYHRDLQCLVAIDLKVTDFKPEYLGKMEFYLESLDRDVKKDHEKPSIGIILCKSKDEQIVEYALSRSVSPAMVSEYKTKLIDKGILKDKLKEFYRIETDLK
jgi:predicted nuclease of restriction endonuclease-like (RecB) superfamily